jgi:glycosyltransferase involved in cell wall biosynthesis
VWVFTHIDNLNMTLNDVNELAMREEKGRSVRPTDPLITIGIPTYNRASFVQNCVASALAQSYQNIEVLVSDNASTDNTLSTLSAIDDGRLRVVTSPVNVGAVNNFSKCVREARGDYLVLISDDNILDPTFLEKCVRLIRIEPDIPIVLAAYDILIMDEFDKNEKRIVPAVLSKKLSTGIWEGTEILEEYFHGRISAQLLSSVIRTDILRRIGYSKHPCAGDEATWIPVLLEGRAGLVNERCATYIVHSSSLSSGFIVDDRLADLCKVIEEISDLMEQKVPNRETRLRMQKIAWRFVAYQAMVTLLLYRRSGASLIKAVQKLWDWRVLLKQCTLTDFVTTLRMRTLARILLPTPVIRWSIARGLDKRF